MGAGISEGLRDVVTPARVLGALVRSSLRLVLLCHAALIIIVLGASLLLLRVNPAATALMAWRGVTAHQAAQPVRFVPLGQIPRAVRNMVVRLEDMHFYQHAGVDLGAIRDAWMINASIGRTAVGGSTIPMQLARNLFLTPRKTYFRKYLEALIAVEMDLVLSKNRILELYLNCIEWGPGVFGIGAAASHYYGTTAGALSLDEMRRLATIITNPLRFNVDTFTGSRQMTERYAYLVSRFPDPEAEPSDQEVVAPLPDPPEPAISAPPEGQDTGTVPPGPAGTLPAGETPADASPAPSS